MKCYLQYALGLVLGWSLHLFARQGWGADLSWLGFRGLKKYLRERQSILVSTASPLLYSGIFWLIIVPGYVHNVPSYLIWAARDYFGGPGLAMGLGLLNQKKKKISLKKQDPPLLYIGPSVWVQTWVSIATSEVYKGWKQGNNSEAGCMKWVLSMHCQGDILPYLAVGGRCVFKWEMSARGWGFSEHFVSRWWRCVVKCCSFAGGSTSLRVGFGSWNPHFTSGLLSAFWL